MRYPISLLSLPACNVSMMRLRTGIRLLILLLWATMAPIMMAALSSVDSLQWKNRVILVYTGEAFPIIRELQNAEAEIDDRDIAWFVVTASGLQTNLQVSVAESLENRIRASFFPEGTPSVILIGKDGQVKDRTPTLDLDRLFVLIDAMPMRRAETRRDRQPD